MTGPLPEDVLKPCPFCGGEPSYSWMIAANEACVSLQCKSCGCVIDESESHLDLDAIRARLFDRWNNPRNAEG